MTELATKRKNEMIGVLLIEEDGLRAFRMQAAPAAAEREVGRPSA